MGDIYDKDTIHVELNLIDIIRGGKDVDRDDIIDKAEKLDDGTNQVTAEEARDHIDDKSNPHEVNKNQVGLGNVPNLDTTEAVDKVHTQGTDKTLGTQEADLDMNDHSILNIKDDSITFKSGGAINREDYLDSVDKKHIRNDDIELKSDISTPSDVILAEEVIPESSIPTELGNVEIIFSSPVNLVSGRKYWISLRALTPNNTFSFYMFSAGDNTPYEGKCVSEMDGVFSFAPVDLYFKTYINNVLDQQQTIEGNFNFVIYWSNGFSLNWKTHQSFIAGASGSLNKLILRCNKSGNPGNLVIEIREYTEELTPFIKDGILKRDLSVDSGKKIGTKTIEDIQDSVDKKHTQNTDNTLFANRSVPNVTDTPLAEVIIPESSIPTSSTNIDIIFPTPAPVNQYNLYAILLKAPNGTGGNNFYGCRNVYRSYQTTPYERGNSGYYDVASGIFYPQEAMDLYFKTYVNDVLDQQQTSETGVRSDFGSNPIQYLYQTFQANINGNLNKITINIRRSGNPGNLVVQIVYQTGADCRFIDFQGRLWGDIKLPLGGIGNDFKLGDKTFNEVFDAVNKKHTQGTDTHLGDIDADLNINNHKLNNVSELGLGTTADSNAYLKISDKFIICKVFTSAGINACIDALGSNGGEVYLPEGEYIISEQIVIDYPNTTLRGSGWGTILTETSGLTTHTINASNKT